MEDELFERPAVWRVEAARNLGLRGDELIAGLVTGAGYPDALVPAAEALRDASAPVVDLGAGLGAATAWLGERTAASVVALEPEVAAARLAAETFTSLRVAASTATAIPLRTASCGGVVLLGVVSLVDELRPLVAEVSRVLQPEGVVVISDLCATDTELWHPDESPNVFRTVPQLDAELEAAGFTVETVWRAPASRSTMWDDAGRRVDEEIERLHGRTEAFGSWKADRERLRTLIDGARVEVATICARLH